MINGPIFSTRVKVIILDHNKDRLDGYDLDSICSNTVEMKHSVYDSVEAISDQDKLTKNDLLMIFLDKHYDDFQATLELVKERFPQSKLLIAINSVEQSKFDVLVGADVDGVVNANADQEEILLAISSVLRGNRYLSPEFDTKFNYTLPNNDKRFNDTPFKVLSQREMQIALMVSTGEKVPEIAKKLFLSPKTVNSYRYRMFSKLSINSDVELTLMAVKYGLVNPHLLMTG